MDEPKEPSQQASPGLALQLQALPREAAALPDIDTRSPDEIVGYDVLGIWADAYHETEPETAA